MRRGYPHLETLSVMRNLPFESLLNGVRKNSLPVVLALQDESAASGEK
jgi:hypothetical protein